MSSTFGTRLRLHREREQISLNDVAARTKIRSSLLEGLERDDISQWPRGLGRRSYVRSYAHAVGLDPETTVREFLALYPDPAEQDDEPAASTTTDSSAHRPRTRFGTLVQSVVGSLVRPGRPRDQRGLPASNVLARQRTDHAASTSRSQLDVNDREPEPHRSRTVTKEGDVALLPVMQVDASDDEFLSEAENPGLIRRHAPPTAAPQDAVSDVTDTSSPSTDADSRAGENAIPDPTVPDATSVRHWTQTDGDLLFHAPLEPLSEAHDLVADAPLSATGREEADDPVEEMRVPSPAAPIQRVIMPSSQEGDEHQIAAHAPDVAARDTAPAIDSAAAVPRRLRAFPIDLPRLSDLCSRIAHARTVTNVTALMPEIAALLDADRVTYWMWDSKAGVLWPSLSAGFDWQQLRQLPRIPHDAENAVAVSFRSREIRVIDGSDEGHGALVVPGITLTHCTGVLALELGGGGERHPSLHALATIIAAQLADVLS